ncbi:hypothetical protein [Halobacillus litoralis]|uniref:Uncharacterized protein n=1 Tax=Halobacillus litoralis TaxID=45668 RepID=A0A410MJ77_9BACI|nr:hypothetical protein [Halobacillus litoralis]QAS54753.1 hypothetical protein HLI_21080 [Halobacillus litoralis]
MNNQRRKYNYDLEEVERLLNDTALSYKEIERQTGCPYSTVIYKSRKIKKNKRDRKQKKLNSPRKDSEITLDSKSDEYAYWDSKSESTFKFEKKNISLVEANQTIKDMVKAAKVLGEKDVNITLDWSSQGTLENIEKQK